MVTNGRPTLDPNLFAAEILSPNQTILPCSASVRDGELCIGGFTVRQLVERHGSPLYILDEDHLRWACREFVESLAREYPGNARVLLATKSLCTQAVCAVAIHEGLGLDVVSEGELVTALASGAPGGMVYLHGNNKNRSELERGVLNGCVIIVDNWYEIELLRGILEENPHARVRVMPRMTPEVESHTYEEVRTGQRDSKFGFCLSDEERLFRELASHDRFDFIGIHAHLGSQLLTLEPFRQGARVMVDLFARAKGACRAVRELNIGGGLGVSYLSGERPPSIAEYVRLIVDEVVAGCRGAGHELPLLVIEPGRAIVAPAMVTAYTVGSIKDIPGVRRYVAVDGGMSDNPRPVTYKSKHAVYHAGRALDSQGEVVTIAGKHCETGDILAKDVVVPRVDQGDIIVVATTGAYNYSQSSNYNRTPRPAIVMVSGDTSDVIVRRETIEELMAFDVVPARLRAGGGD